MKQISKLLSPIWWIVIGILLFLSGILYIDMSSMVAISLVGIIIICGILNDSKFKPVAITANIVLALFTIMFAIYSFMIIGVASPVWWFAVALIFINIGNILFCIKSIIKLIGR